MNGPLWPEGTGRERENLGNFDQQLVQFVAKRCYCSSCKREPKCGKKRSTSNFDVRTSYQVAIYTILSNNTSTSFPDSTK